MTPRERADRAQRAARSALRAELPRMGIDVGGQYAVTVLLGSPRQCRPTSPDVLERVDAQRTGLPFPVVPYPRPQSLSHAHPHP